MLDSYDGDEMLFEEETPNVDVNEISEVLKETKIEITEEDKEKYSIETTKKKPGRKPNVKKDLPTPDEVDKMSDDEIESVAGNSINDLYLEFSSFLEDKAKIKQDVGIKETISTGIDILDTIMGGGFAIGTMGMIAGSPGAGKSMLGIQCMANAQLKYKGNILASYLDSEEATTIVRMSNLGVRYPKIKPYNDITIEKVFKFIESLCLYKEMKEIIDQPSMIIWDSVANTLCEKERNTEDVNSVIGFKARLLSILIPKYVSKLSIYNISLITINQLRDDIQIGPMVHAKDLNFMKKGKTIPGGNTLKFNAFHLLDMRVKGVTDPAKYGFDGIICEVRCVKNKLFPPNIKIDMIGNFITGFSNFWTNYTFLVDNKRLTASGWSYLNSLPNNKFRTKEAESLYKTDPEFKLAFDETLKEAIHTELILKYTIEESNSENFLEQI